MGDSVVKLGFYFLENAECNLIVNVVESAFPDEKEYF